jgi:hypothetical protein
MLYNFSFSIYSGLSIFHPLLIVDLQMIFPYVYWLIHRLRHPETFQNSQKAPSCRVPKMTSSGSAQWQTKKVASTWKNGWKKERIRNPKRYLIYIYIIFIYHHIIYIWLSIDIMFSFFKWISWIMGRSWRYSRVSKGKFFSVTSPDESVSNCQKRVGKHRRNQQHTLWEIILDTILDTNEYLWILVDLLMDIIYIYTTLWEINIDPDNHQFLEETNLPTPIRVYVNLLEGKSI